MLYTDIISLLYNVQRLFKHCFMFVNLKLPFKILMVYNKIVKYYLPPALVCSGNARLFSWTPENLPLTS